jgi:hypothetical protein
MRIDKKLPANFTKEIFYAMEKHFGQNRTIHPGDMVIDTSASNYGAFEHNAASENTPLHKDMKLEMLERSCDIHSLVGMEMPLVQICLHCSRVSISWKFLVYTIRVS